MVGRSRSPNIFARRNDNREIQNSKSAIVSTGRFFVAIAIFAFGVQHLIYGEFVTRLIPKLPGWIPSHHFLAYFIGVALICSAGALLLQMGARIAGIFVAALGLFSVVALYLPRLAPAIHNGGLWTATGKALALSGAVLLAAGLLSEAGIWFLSAFLILGGIQHFIYPQFVATLVPAWIPGHLVWTYFAGIALIAGGIGMILRMTRSIAGYLTGIMIFLWVISLHIPRALATPHDANETTAVFEALAFSGAAFLAAKSQKSTSLARGRKSPKSR